VTENRTRRNQRRQGDAERPRAPRPRPTRRQLVRLLVIAFVLFAWAYAIFGQEGLLRQWRRGAEHEVLSARLAEERTRTGELRREVDALRHDDLAIEDALRDQLDYRRPGELILILDDGDPLTTNDPVRIDPPKSAPVHDPPGLTDP
jgi:cell division protein FtsB